MGERHRHRMTQVHTNVFEHLRLLNRKNIQHVLEPRFLNEIKQRFRNAKALLKDILGSYYETAL